MRLKLTGYTGNSSLFAGFVHCVNDFLDFAILPPSRHRNFTILTQQGDNDMG